MMSENDNLSEQIDVSVVILTYNQKEYILNTLESIVKQECTCNIEIIIGDDCSTDGTSELILDYAKKYPKIIKTFIQKKNLGLIKHYYFLVNLCHGKYVMFCGGDDYWLPGKLKCQYEYMENHSDIGLTYGKTMYLHQNGLDQNLFADGNSRSEKFENLILSNGISGVAVCVRRDTFIRFINDVNPLEKTWRMEDYPRNLWFSLYSKIAYIDYEMAVYRILNDSVSHSSNIDKQLAFLESEKDVRDYFLLRYAELSGNETCKFHKELDKTYNRRKAEIFLSSGNIIEFRTLNFKSKSAKGIIKNLISYFPFGKKFLLQRHM